jgi:SAM-dependent methyltransferase
LKTENLVKEPIFTWAPINAPLLCVTSDLDWASDYCIRDFAGLMREFRVRPTFFVTHESAAIRALAAEGAAELAVHPNFNPGSSHGSTEEEVIDTVFRLVPESKAWRSHCFVDSSSIAESMTRRGMEYDSNLCLHRQAGLVPLAHALGGIRYPVFFEDDVQLFRSPGDWNLNADEFLTPGLKVLNFHPFFVAANIPSEEYYQSVKPHIKTLDETTVRAVRYSGVGTRTLLLRLLEELARRGERFYTLDEIHRMLHPRRTAGAAPDAGRNTLHSDAEYHRYWQLSDGEKQEFLKQSYRQRNPADPYATSRDVNVRDLEIAALRRNLAPQSRVLDLGCGNGFTLLALAEYLPGCDMTGVDFVAEFISVAIKMRDDKIAKLQSKAEFVCADAVKFAAQCDPGSLDFCITERFLQNLPSPEVQQVVVGHIYRALRPGGVLLMCEGSEDGFESLNDLRVRLGLPAIPATSADNVSAIRFKDVEIEAAAAQTGFSLDAKIGFSQFFTITRVLHPLLVLPQQPRFDAKINSLAKELQLRTEMKPGIGSNTLWVLRKGG